MKKLFTILPLALLLCFTVGCQNKAAAEVKQSNEIILTKTPIERAAQYAVWRTDYYICTGIAYAKSIGKGLDDFMNFVAANHVEALMNMKGKGLAPVIQLMNTVITSYPNGTLEIVSESEKTVKLKSNRPYSTYFNNGPIIGVTIEEFEKCIWGHLELMWRELEIEFEYQIEGDFVECTLSLRE